MDWRNIPSLSALRAFEAAARLGNFSAAARELNVTHAAIAQHTRALEAHFGTSLMVRQGRQMELTDSGRKLARSLVDGFGTISSGIEQIKRDISDAPVRIAITPSLAEHWLVPRLGHFWCEYPDIQLALQPSTQVVDLAKGDADVALRFGHGDWPELHSEQILGGKLFVLGTTKYVPEKPVRELTELSHLSWIINSGWQEQLAYMNNAGLDLDELDATFFPTSDLVLSAVRAGYGVTLSVAATADQDIAANNLHKIFAVDSGKLAYHVVHVAGRTSQPTQTFIDWIKSQAQANLEGKSKDLGCY